MYLLDTNVVSELRRTRPHGAVLAWLSTVHNADLFISAATVGEIQAGIERTREDDIAKAGEIEKWLTEVVLSMNVIAPDAEIFRIWARFMHKRQSHLWDDAMIAATAVQHHATVVTRNVRDFELFGVEILDPFR
jgi:predicted nucleic acid-binding protein